jgi:hypothetical protein
MHVWMGSFDIFVSFHFVLCFPGHDDAGMGVSIVTLMMTDSFRFVARALSMTPLGWITVNVTCLPPERHHHDNNTGTIKGRRHREDGFGLSH